MKTTEQGYHVYKNGEHEHNNRPDIRPMSKHFNANILLHININAHFR
jgi:hypothetical protein